jgi:GH15 family glucan-1,4-alpha-glucosidase
MYSLGFDWEAVDFYAFIAEIAEDDSLQIMYGIGGERELTEHELDHLPGYADSRPVRIGNAAYAQQQHDAWGALLDSVYLHSKAVDYLDNRVWPILEKQVAEALKHWREPDAGIWEVRGELQHFTLRRSCAGSPPGRRLAALMGEDGKAAERQRAAEEIKEGHPRQRRGRAGVFTQYWVDGADASLPLAPLMRFPPPGRPTDPRHRDGDQNELPSALSCAKVEETDDGFTGEEAPPSALPPAPALCEIGDPARPASCVPNCRRSLARWSSTARDRRA